MTRGLLPMPESSRELLRRTLERVDAFYRERFQLAPVGPLLYVGLERHAGEPFALSDGTRLEPGAWIGRLHINNTRAAAVEADSRPQAGIRFGRLLRDSFSELAERARGEAPLREVAVFEGITWLRAHGGTVGFDAEPLPHGPRRWLLGAHFRLLIWAFAPVARGAAILDVEPHRFRITRRALIESFGARRQARHVQHLAARRRLSG
jgi:YkoP domain